MNYELAKKLKDAGFPQDDDNENLTCQCGITGCEIHFPYKSFERVYFPELSELIEACGDKFLYLEKEGKKWRANETGEYVGNTKKSDKFNFYITGESCLENFPEEAVANLWLELNKGKNK